MTSIEASSSASALRPPLRITIEGEAVLRTVTIRNATEVVVGRDAHATVRLLHDAVSRRHMRLFERGGAWFAEDLGSKHGSVVDGVLLVPRQPVPIGASATILVRPFALRVDLGGSSVMTSLSGAGGEEGTSAAGVALAAVRDGAPSVASGSAAPAFDDVNDLGSIVRSFDVEALNELNARRLGLLLQAAEEINAARDERGIAEAATAALIAGTGFARALWLRRGGDLDTLETLSVRTTPDSDAVPSARVSGTLIRAAAGGAPVMLEDHAPLLKAESIDGAGVAAALCAPVIVPPVVEAFLYLDSQRRSARPTTDAATFCHLVTKLSGMALADLRRRAVEQRQRELERQLDAARRAQQRLVPAERGEASGCRWRLYTRPGFVVAGDVAGVHGRDELFTFFVGDVRGKGVDAAIVMTMVATRLAAYLDQRCPLEQTMRDLNSFVHLHRRDHSDFATLFLGQIDRDSRRIRTIDAGQGLALLFRNGQPTPIESEGGLPLGIDADTSYEVSEFPLDHCDRVLIYTDGVSEQTGGDSGRQLGPEQVVQAVTGADSADLTVERLRETLRAHAGGEVFADDVTILAVDL